jgi:hypothetical protein
MEMEMVMVVRLWSWYHWLTQLLVWWLPEGLQTLWCCHRGQVLWCFLQGLALWC